MQFHIREDILAICGEFRYKHLYTSQIEWMDARLHVNYSKSSNNSDKLVISFPNLTPSDKMREIFEVFGISDSIEMNITNIMLNRDSQSSLLIENKSSTLDQTYIIEINNVQPKEYSKLLYYICGCYQMSSVVRLVLM